MKNFCFALALVVGASLFAGSTATAQTIIADLYNDYAVPANTGWTYLWNPSGVTIGDGANYVALSEGPQATAYSHDTTADPVDPVAVGTVGGNGNNVGFHAAGGTVSIRIIGGFDASVPVVDGGDGLDHYAIARYTIQPGEEGDVTFDSLGPVNATTLLPTGINFNGQQLGTNVIAAYKNNVLIGTANEPPESAQFNAPVNFDFGTCAVGDTLDLAFLTPDNSGASRNQRRFFVGSTGFTHTFTSTPSVTVLLGDVNLDSTVDFLDISPFIGVLSGGTFQAEADCDESGAVDFLDISPFIAILSGS